MFACGIGCRFLSLPFILYHFFLLKLEINVYLSFAYVFDLALLWVFFSLCYKMLYIHFDDCNMQMTATAKKNFNGPFLKNSFNQHNPEKNHFLVSPVAPE